MEDVGVVGRTMIYPISHHSTYMYFDIYSMCTLGRKIMHGGIFGEEGGKAPNVTFQVPP